MAAIKVNSDVWDYIEKNGRICTTNDISIGEYVYELINPHKIIIK